MNAMKLRSFGLFLETIVFTIVVPGTVTVLIPSRILGDETRILFQPWTATSFTALLPLSLGAAIYFRCLWEFAARGRGIPLPIDHPRQLVVTGLYRYVRNPMYVGILAMNIGHFLWFGYWNLLIYTVVVFVGFNLFVIYYEEPTLKRKFGAAYEDYLQRVPRWIPRFK